MALSRPTCISTWASAATSPIQEGVEGTDSGFTWMVTDVCVILGVCPPLREIEIFTSFLIRRHISSVFSTLLLTAQLNNLVAHLVGDGPCQKQVRDGDRKRAPASTSDHPASPGVTAGLYQDGSDAAGSSSEDGSELETSPPHC